MLIQGNNLEALKALFPFYAGQVKCIYIDPPYNTGSAFEHYDDYLEHTVWLSMMYPRLLLLRELLTEGGHRTHTISMLLGGAKLKWNPKTEIFEGDRTEEANKNTFYAREQREPWGYDKIDSWIVG